MPVPMGGPGQSYSYSQTRTSYLPAAVGGHAPAHAGMYNNGPPGGAYSSITIERTFPLDKWIMAGHLLVLLVPILCMFLHFFAQLYVPRGTTSVYRGFELLVRPDVNSGRVLFMRISLWAALIINGLLFIFCLLRLLTANDRRSPFDLIIKLLNYLHIIVFVMMIVVVILFRDMPAYGIIVYMIMYLIALLYVPVSMGGGQAFSLVGNRDDD